ncbi:MAG: hypothetical protein ABSD62_13510 [Candidatus Limnocylindrales bacterium]
MTAERRLARIEETLSPTQLVLRWLAQAHAYGDIEPYVASLLDQDPPVPPLDGLAREAARGARSATRGKRADLVDAAVRSALRETVFRYELVMRINVTTHELLDREGLIDAALSANVALLVCEDPEERQADPSYLSRFATLRDLLGFRVIELDASQEARTIVEARHLDGHPALFPDLAAAFEQQVKDTQTIADAALHLAEFAGVRAALPTDPEAASARTAELVADLVEPAKSEALDKLGEGRQALGIAAGWVRTKLGALPTPDAKEQGHH